ncbi:MAG: SUF system Fe-S cluster assembly regulator [Zetaproteobacteria bacterium]|nr:SUF system Fe-S cluster assembly regulator [Zetaproteobacteria bacterium]
MLRLTKITDYGILLMAQLASGEADELFSTSALTDATKIPSTTVSKILQSLLNADLLISIRGVKGGYKLARAADLISVRDIVCCLEGDIALTDCSSSDALVCDQRGVCITHGNWKRINQAMHDVLANISLSDMINASFTPVIRLQRGLPIVATSGESQ